MGRGACTDGRGRAGAGGSGGHHFRDRPSADARAWRSACPELIRGGEFSGHVHAERAAGVRAEGTLPAWCVRACARACGVQARATPALARAGVEGSGRVEAVGEGVSTPRVGDRVAYVVTPPEAGAFAHFTAVSAQKAFKVRGLEAHVSVRGWAWDGESRAAIRRYFAADGRGLPTAGSHG